MAVEKRKGRASITFRAYWRNPHTGKIERGPARNSRAEAERDDAEIKVRLKFEPESFSGSAPAAGQAPTFASLARLYVSRSDIAENTRESSHTALRQVMPFLGKIQAESLTRRDFKLTEMALADTGVRQSTVHRYISVAHAVLGWARDTGLIDEHKLDGLRVSPGENRRQMPPTPDEVRKILAEAKPHLRRAVLLSYYLGMRFGPSEVFSARWSDLDEETKTLRVGCIKNKKRIFRYVLIRDSLFEEMLQWRAADLAAGIGLIVHYSGRKVRRMRGAWLSALQKAGITRELTPYSLRHAFVTEALAGGADVKAVADMVGHQSLAMIYRHYQHVLGEQRVRAANAVPEVLGIQRGIQTPPKTPIIQYPDENKIEQ